MHSKTKQNWNRIIFKNQLKQNITSFFKVNFLSNICKEQNQSESILVFPSVKYQK